MNTSFSRKRGFTLIELLVVIAIIAILAAILFPVFARARENARRASCQSNLKQIGLGIAQYSQDYDEQMPKRMTNNPSTNWVIILQPYVKSYQLFRCPSNTRNTVQMNDDTSGLAAGQGPVVSYSPNVDASNSGGPFANDGGSTVSIADIEFPATTIAVLESNMRNSDFVITASHFAGPNAGDSGNSSASLFSGHLSTANFLFADGHVKALRPTATYNAGASQNMWHRKNQLYTGGDLTNCLEILNDSVNLYK